MTPWDEERESHIEMRAELNRRAGMTPEEARRAAERSFGNRLKVEEEMRAVSIPTWLDQLAQDVRHAVRSWRREPLFALTVAATLALGIGAATAVFSFADRILFRPLPYANERELVWFGMSAPIGGGNEFVLEWDFAAWRKRELPFRSLAAHAGGADCSLTEVNPVRLRCFRVTADWLTVFGYRPVAGRDFAPEDALPGATPSALISSALWRDRLGGRPVTGQTIEIDGTRTRILGVLPVDFETPSLQRVDIVEVLRLNPNAKPGDPSLLLTPFARLRPGVTVEQARQRMRPLFEQALESVPAGFRQEIRFVVYPLRDRLVRDSARGAWLLLAAVGLMLAIAVANAANLLVARAAARGREWAVRAAIGAGRMRLARQALTEALVLGVAGGAAGLALAAILLRVMRALAPQGIARLDEAAIDGRLAAFAVALTLGATLTAGLAAALRRPSAESLLGARVVGRRRERLRPALVAVQIALSLVLLCGAALLLESLRNMANTPLGMETASLLSAEVELPGARYPQPEKRHAFFRQARERVAATPGVEALAMSSSLPPQGRMQSRIYASVWPEGRPRQPGAPTGGMIVVREVSANYFRVLGIPLRQGRAFLDQEKDAVIISERLAARMFAGESPVGRRLVMSGGAPAVITGVAADVRNAGLVDPEPEIYRHSPPLHRRQYLIIRGDTRVIPAVRAIFTELDPRLLVNFETLDERVRQLRARPRFQSVLFGGFAAAGLLLAAVGLYGVAGLLIAQRTGEFGVRMALGATPRDIRMMVMRQAGAWAAIGLAAGSVGAWVGGRWLEGLLYGVSPGAPGPLLAAVAVLGLTALGAAWAPAYRASRSGVMETLRQL